MDASSNHPEKISLVFLKLVVYFSMIFCAAIILLTRPYLVSAIRDAYLSPFWVFLGPLLFLVLFIGFLVLQSMEKSALPITLVDLVPFFFGIGLSVMLLHAAYLEYNARTLKKPLDIDFVAQFTSHKDARIRALAILALSASQFDDHNSSSLIHRALLDKDPIVQQAAKLVIEENLGIRFKNGAEGTKQAQDLMLETYPSALLTRKGSP